ncbi:transposase [Leifsonia sp. ZF2019]|nr:transposase [Leifsonia sp. ZF2019]
MPRPYPQEFRARAVALVRAGKQAKQTAVEIGIHPITLSNWIRPDDIDNGRRPGVPSSESAELRAAKRRIRELETELLIVRQAAKFLDEERRTFGFHFHWHPFTLTTPTQSRAGGCLRGGRTRAPASLQPFCRKPCGDSSEGSPLSVDYAPSATSSGVERHR